MNRRQLLKGLGAAALAVPVAALAIREEPPFPVGWKIAEEIDEPPFYGRGIMDMLEDLERERTRWIDRITADVFSEGTAGGVELHRRLFSA